MLSNKEVSNMAKKGSVRMPMGGKKMPMPVKKGGCK